MDPNINLLKQAHQAKDELNELASIRARRKLDVSLHDADRRRDAILDERVRAASRCGSRAGAATRPPSRPGDKPAEGNDVSYRVYAIILYIERYFLYLLFLGISVMR